MNYFHVLNLHALIVTDNYFYIRKFDLERLQSPEKNIYSQAIKLNLFIGYI